jgi:hypothetical protein
MSKTERPHYRIKGSCIFFFDRAPEWDAEPRFHLQWASSSTPEPQRRAELAEFICDFIVAYGWDAAIERRSS